MCQEEWKMRRAVRSAAVRLVRELRKHHPFFLGLGRRAEQHSGRVGEGLPDLQMTCRPIAQPHPRPQHALARHLRRLRHSLSTCRLASRWKEYMAFLRSFYVADDIWRFA